MITTSNERENKLPSFVSKGSKISIFRLIIVCCIPHLFHKELMFTYSMISLLGFRDLTFLTFYYYLLHDFLPINYVIHQMWNY